LLVSKSEEPSTSPGSREVEVTTRPPRFISCRGRRSSSPSICKTANWGEHGGLLDEPGFALGRGATGNAGGLEGQDFELRGDFDLVSASGLAMLGIGIAGGLQGLRTAAIDPQKLSNNPCQHAGMRRNQTQFPAASHCGICIVVIKAARKTKKGHLSAPEKLR